MIEVAPNDPSRRAIELTAGGPDDPDASRAAAVLSAYLQAEHMRAFRQLLWRRLAALAGVWSLLGVLSSLFTRGAIIGGLALFAAAAILAAVVEWRASERLVDLLRARDAKRRSQFVASIAEMRRPSGPESSA